MTKSETFGEIRQEAARHCEYLDLAFSPLRVPVRSRWRNNGLSADFLGDYVVTFLPTKDGVPIAEAKQKEIRHAVAYIANELLENAMKYHQQDANEPIGIHMELTSDSIAVSANHGTSAQQARRYKDFIGTLLAGDVDELLVQQLEENSKSDESAASCLGLLTMIADYGTELGWRFDTDSAHPDTMTVTTTAVLPLLRPAEEVTA